MQTSFPRRRSLLLWALLALAMVAVSYVVVLFIAAGCVYVPYLVFMSTDAGLQSVALALCGVSIAATMLWSLVPRPDTFEAPGPTLYASAQQKLFTELEKIAAALNEPMPDEVYLIPQANAFVADRGGTMGVGARRVMGIGLPLIAVMNVDEFRAVLAHEFAHYYGGDTRLGPWVYKTRMAMVRAIQNMASIGSWMRIAIAALLYRIVLSILQAYWKVFLRATQLVSRRQEYRADELACYIAGSNSLTSGLKKVHTANAAFPAYWNSEVLPFLNLGYRPPITEGFSLFVQAPEVSVQLEQLADKEISQPKTSAYDSHPPLRDRIAAVKLFEVGNQGAGSESAMSLFADLVGEEWRVLSWKNSSSQVSAMKPLTWQDLAVSLPQIWRDLIQKNAQFLGDLTTDLLPDAVPKLAEIGSRIPDPKGMLLTPQQRTTRAAELFGAALALAVSDAGWPLHMQPGERYFEVGMEQVSVRELMGRLLSDKITREEWGERCRTLKISGVRLVVPKNLAAGSESA